MGSKHSRGLLSRRQYLRRHRAVVPMIRWPGERAPVSPKGSSKQRSPGSIHRIRTMACRSRTGGKRSSKTTINRDLLLESCCAFPGIGLFPSRQWLAPSESGKGGSPSPRDIVAQLFNAYVGSRAKALEVIGKHNALVERYNRLNDEKSALRLQLAGQKVEEAASQMDYDRATQDKGIQQNTPVDERSTSR